MLKRWCRGIAIVELKANERLLIHAAAVKVRPVGAELRQGRQWDERLAATADDRQSIFRQPQDRRSAGFPVHHSSNDQRDGRENQLDDAFHLSGESAEPGAHGDHDTRGAGGAQSNLGYKPLIMKFVPAASRFDIGSGNLTLIDIKQMAEQSRQKIRVFLIGGETENRLVGSLDVNAKMPIVPTDARDCP